MRGILTTKEDPRLSRWAWRQSEQAARSALDERTSVGSGAVSSNHHHLRFSVGNQVLDEEKTLARLQTLMRSEHWLATYVSDLLSAHDLSAGIDFRTAEQLLAAEKEQFEKDLAIARRMLRVYGKQVMAENMSQTAYAPSNG
jgi:hypothetical protein